jgi:hypothetical protein
VKGGKIGLFKSKNKRGKTMKVFGMVIFLVLLSLAEARPLKFDVPLIEVTPAVYTKATENLESSTEDSAYWEIVTVDDDLAQRSSVSSFKDGLLNFVPTLAPLVLENNDTTTLPMTLLPISWTGFPTIPVSRSWEPRWKQSL